MLIAIARLQQIMHVFAEPKLLPRNEPWKQPLYLRSPLCTTLAEQAGHIEHPRLSTARIEYAPP